MLANIIVEMYLLSKFDLQVVDLINLNLVTVNVWRNRAHLLALAAVLFIFKDFT